MKTELVIFDIDGTLLDSREKYYECMAHTLRAFGTRDKILKVIKETFGMPGPATMRRLGAKEDEIDGLMVDIYSYIQDSPIRAKPFYNIDEMLRGMRSICKIAVATSRNCNEVAFDSDVAPLLKYMDYVSTTEADMTPKPAPDVLLEALERLSIDATRAIYVGDTTSDMACAKAAGMRFILAGWNPEALRTVRPDSNTDVCLSVNSLIESIQR